MKPRINSYGTKWNKIEQIEQIEQNRTNRKNTIYIIQTNIYYTKKAWIWMTSQRVI